MCVLFSQRWSWCLAHDSKVAGRVPSEIMLKHADVALHTLYQGGAASKIVPTVLIHCIGRDPGHGPGLHSPGHRPPGRLCQLRELRERRGEWHARGVERPRRPRHLVAPSAVCDLTWQLSCSDKHGKVGSRAGMGLVSDDAIDCLNATILSLKLFQAASPNPSLR